MKIIADTCIWLLALRKQFGAQAVSILRICLSNLNSFNLKIIFILTSKQEMCLWAFQSKLL